MEKIVSITWLFDKVSLRDRIMHRLYTRCMRWKERFILRQYGGYQRCPWCMNIFSEYKGSRIEEDTEQPMFDRMKCGCCKGESLWLWGMGFHFIGVDPNAPPDGKAHDRASSLFQYQKNKN